MVAKLVQRRIAGKVDHGRWAAEQHNCVVLGGQQVSGNHVLVDEAHTVGPACTTRLRKEELVRGHKKR